MCLFSDRLNTSIADKTDNGLSYRIFAVLLSLLLALAKHKESGDILITILSFFAFWATLFGLQVWSFNKSIQQIFDDTVVAFLYFLINNIMT